MTNGNKFALTFFAVLLGIVWYGSVALRHAFVEMHNHAHAADDIVAQCSAR